MPKHQSPREPQEIPGPLPAGIKDHQYILLDGLRGLAAIIVAILHMPRVFAGFTVPNAHLSVDFFLQLSGFVIAAAYAKKIQDGMKFHDFIWKRVNRLFPTYFIGFILGLIVAFAALLFGGNGLTVKWNLTDLIRSAIPNFFMLPQINSSGNGLLFPINPPMWSIFFEIIVNILFFISIPLILGIYKNVIVTIILACTLIILAPASGFDVGFTWSDFGLASLRIICSFLIGITIFNAKTRSIAKSDIQSIILPLILGIALLSQTNNITTTSLTVFVIFPLIVIVGSRFNPENEKIRWAFIQSGKISYVLYVIHKPLYQIIYAAILKINSNLPAILGAWLGISILTSMIVIAWFISRNYEPIARERLNKFIVWLAKILIPKKIRTS